MNAPEWRGNLAPAAGEANAAGAEIALLERRLARERAARKAAEALLTDKSRALFDTAQAAKQAERRLQLALWGSGEGIWEWQTEDDRLDVSGLEVMGLPFQLNTPTLTDLLQQVLDLDRDALSLAFRLYFRGARDDIDTAFRLMVQGQQRWLRIRGRALERDAQGRAVRVTGTVKDVTAQREAEHSLHLMAHAFASTHDALVVIDDAGQVVQANSTFCTLMGQPANRLEGQPLPLLLNLTGDNTFDSAWRGECTLPARPAQGQGAAVEERHVEVSVTPVEGQGGHSSCYIVALRDISQRRLAEQALQRLAMNDTLTGLPNRAAISAELQRRTARTDPSGAAAVEPEPAPFALLFMDLDGFKPINDTLGHRAGDQVLIEVAQRMGRCLPEAFVGRWGGDEFVVMLASGSGAPEAARAAAMLVHSIGQPMVVEDQVVTTTPSLGAVLCPQDGDDAASLLRRADAAMYVAKSQGRNQLVHFHPALDEGLQRRTRLQSLLRVDAERGAFHFVLQPQFSRAGRVVGAELLMRWTTQTFGAVSPSEFIPLAEQTGLIERMGRYALDAAAQAATQAGAQGHDVRVAVNLSPRQLLREDIEHILLDTCQRHGARPQQLTLELTESALVTDIQQVATLLVRLRQQGFHLALDDFGTGYSSLSHLRQLPFHKVKIDRSFVQDLETDPKGELVLQGIVQLCNSLGLATVAEGVENTRQHHSLLGLGVQEFQGFLLAKPQPVDVWLALLDAQDGQASAAQAVETRG